MPQIPTRLLAEAQRSRTTRSRRATRAARQPSRAQRRGAGARARSQSRGLRDLSSLAETSSRRSGRSVSRCVLPGQAFALAGERGNKCCQASSFTSVPFHERISFSFRSGRRSRLDRPSAERASVCHGVRSGKTLVGGSPTVPANGRAGVDRVDHLHRRPLCLSRGRDRAGQRPRPATNAGPGRPRAFAESPLRGAGGGRGAASPRTSSTSRSCRRSSSSIPSSRLARRAGRAALHWGRSSSSPRSLQCRARAVRVEGLGELGAYDPGHVIAPVDTQLIVGLSSAPAREPPRRRGPGGSRVRPAARRGQRPDEVGRMEDAAEKTRRKRKAAKPAGPSHASRERHCARGQEDGGGQPDEGVLVGRTDTRRRGPSIAPIRSKNPASP